MIPDTATRLRNVMNTHPTLERLVADDEKGMNRVRCLLIKRARGRIVWMIRACDLIQRSLKSGMDSIKELKDLVRKMPSGLNEISAWKQQYSSRA